MEIKGNTVTCVVLNNRKFDVVSNEKSALLAEAPFVTFKRPSHLQLLLTVDDKRGDRDFLEDLFYSSVPFQGAIHFCSGKEFIGVFHSSSPDWVFNTKAFVFLYADLVKK